MLPRFADALARDPPDGLNAGVLAAGVRATRALARFAGFAAGLDAALLENFAAGLLAGLAVGLVAPVAGLAKVPRSIFLFDAGTVPAPMPAV